MDLETRCICESTTSPLCCLAALIGFANTGCPCLTLDFASVWTMPPFLDVPVRTFLRTWILKVLALAPRALPLPHKLQLQAHRPDTLQVLTRLVRVQPAALGTKRTLLRAVLPSGRLLDRRADENARGAMLVALTSVRLCSDTSSSLRIFVNGLNGVTAGLQSELCGKTRKGFSRRFVCGE